MTLATIWQDFSQPEYIHVLINPLPVYGLAIAWLGLIAAIIMRSRGGQVTALALVFISARPPGQSRIMARPRKIASSL